MKLKLCCGIMLTCFVAFGGMNVFAEDMSMANISVNNLEMEFETTPIFMEDDVMVSLTDFGKAVNANVVWDGEGSSFAIGYGDSAYLANTADTIAFVGKDYNFNHWECITQKQASIYRIMDKTILIPLKEVCTELEIVCDVDADSNTISIFTQSNNTKMTPEKLRYMDLVYYVNQHSADLYKASSDDIEEFFAQRQEFRDAVKMGVSDIWAGVKDLISGNSNAENVMKDCLEAIMTVLPDNEIIIIDHTIEDWIKDYTDALSNVTDYGFNNIKKMIENIPELDGFSGYLSELQGFYEELQAAVDSYEDLSSQYKGISYIYEFAAYADDVLAILFSDYSMNIEYLDVLQKAITDSGWKDDTVNTSIELLKAEYTIKFLHVILDFQDRVIENGIQIVADTATGGFFSIGEFAWETLFGITGISSEGEALKRFYGLYCLNGPLDAAYKMQYQKILEGTSTEEELEKFKKLDDLQRALKRRAYECIRNITDDADTQAYCKIKETEYSEGCIRFKSVLTLVSDSEQILHYSENLDNIYSLYEKLVGEYVYSGGERYFATYDINNDGIKELIIRNPNIKSPVPNDDSPEKWEGDYEVFAVEKSELIKLGAGKFGGWGVYNNEHIIINECADVVSIYDISSGLLELVDEYRYNVNYASYVNIAGNEQYTDVRKYIQEKYGKASVFQINSYNSKEDAMLALYQELYGDSEQLKADQTISSSEIDKATGYETILDSFKKGREDYIRYGKAILDEGSDLIVSNLVDLGYCFMDLNHDGIWELLIGNANINDSNNWGEIYALYTLIDENPTVIHRSYIRKTLHLCENDILKQYNMGGARIDYTIFYDFAVPEMILKDAVIFDVDANGQNPYFYSVKHPDAKEYISISEEEAEELRNRYPLKKIDYTPISQWQENKIELHNRTLEKSIEASNYFQNYQQLVNLLQMDATDEWKNTNVHSSSYWKDGLSLLYNEGGSKRIFDIENEGNLQVTMYGIYIGESVLDLNEKLLENGWILEFKGDDYWTYCSLQDEETLYQEVRFDAENNIESWYVKNWPQGEVYGIMFQQLRGGEQAEPLGAFVAIPDATLRTYILEKYDTNQDQYLSLEERSKVTEINVDNYGITSMQGIEYFPNLSVLMCDNNKIRDLDVSSNLQLSVLTFNGNLVSEIDLSYNTNLTELYCKNNQLTSLDVSNNPELIALDCSNNMITDLNTNKNPKLEILYF